MSRGCVVAILFLLYMVGPNFTFAQFPAPPISKDTVRLAFQLSLDSEFSTDDFREYMSAYDFLYPELNWGLIQNPFKDVHVKRPLAWLAGEELYRTGIERLVNSTNAYQRILGYRFLIAANDTTFLQIMRQRLNEAEKDEAEEIWMALVYLQDDHTTLIFDYYLEHKPDVDHHIAPLLPALLNKDSLRQTAYRRFDSQDTLTRALAATLLSYTELNDSTATLLRHAVSAWPAELKRIALNSMIELQVGDIRDIVVPLLDDSTLRAKALQALADSPVESDRQVFLDLIPDGDTVSLELLHVLHRSRNDQSLEVWFQILQSGLAPGNYKFLTSNDKEINKEIHLASLLSAARHTPSDDIRMRLMRYLKGRQDDKTVSFLVEMLEHQNPNVRSQAAGTLNPSNHPLVTKKALELLFDDRLTPPGLFYILPEDIPDTARLFIENRVISDSTGSGFLGEYSYVLRYPRPEDTLLFQSLLGRKGYDEDRKYWIQINLDRLQGKEHVYEKIEIIEPSEAQKLWNQVMAISDSGWYDSAVTLSNMAFLIEPRTFESYFYRGLAYHHKRNYEQAIDDYSWSIELNPDFALAYYNKGRAFEGAGRVKEAIDSYELYLRYAPPEDSLGISEVQEWIESLQNDR